MPESSESLAYPEGANQLLRALYDYEAEYPASFAAYDDLVNEGDVSPGFRWVRRFVDDMTERGFIEAAKTLSPEGGWGMRILPRGQTHVEEQLAANAAWGRKPVQVVSGSRRRGSAFGSAGYGTGTFAGASISEGSLSSAYVSASPEPSAGTAIGVSDSVQRHEATSPTVTIAAPSPAVDPTEWTGVQSRAVRLAVVRDLIPLAQNAIDQMIEQLSRPGDNGGPKLDEDQAALDALRNLHAALSKILAAIDGGSFGDELGEGLVAEAYRYGQRVVESVKNDPMRYAVAVLIFGVTQACGLGSIGSLVAGLAGRIEKPKKGK